MKTENSVYKVLGIIGASLFSIVIVLAMFVTAVYSSARSLITPKNISNIVTTTLETTIESSLDDLGGKAELQGFSKEAVKAVITSDAASKLIELYAGDAIKILEGKQAEQSFTAQAIIDLVNEHADEITANIIKVEPEANPERLKEKIITAVNDNAQLIVDNIPSPNVIVSELDLGENAYALSKFLSSTVHYTLWGIIAALALIIFCLRLYRLRGIKWIGIDALVSAGSLLALYYLISSKPVTNLIKEAGESGIFIIDGIKSNILTYFIGFAAAGAVLVALAIVVRYLYIRKDKANQPDIEVETLQEEYIEQ